MSDPIRSSNLPVGSSPDYILGHEVIGAQKITKQFPRANVLGPVESRVATLEANQSLGTPSKAYATVSAMTAALGATAVNTLVAVTSDPLGDVNNGNGLWLRTGGGWVWQRPLDFIAPVVYAYRPLVNVDGVLRIPQLYRANRAGTIDASFTPAGGETYRRFVPIGTVGQGEYIHFEPLAGDPIVSTIAGSGSQNNSALIGRMINGLLETSLPVARIVPNEFGYGKVSPGASPALRGTTSECDIVDASLVALGFTKGCWDTVSGTPIVGGYFKKPVDRASTAFVRLLVQSVTPNNFYAPTAYTFRNNNGAIVDNGTLGALLLEQQLSANAAIYSGAFAISPSDGADGIWAGSLTAPGPPTGPIDYRICGLQFAVSADRNIWIAGGDYPVPAPPSREVCGTGGNIINSVIPRHAFLISGRPTSWRLSNLVEEVGACQNLEFELAAIGTTGASVPYTLKRPGNDDMLLDATRVPASPTAFMRVRDLSRIADEGASQSISIYVSPATGTGSKKILVIGDSLSNRYVPALTDAKLTGMGYAPAWLGTKNTLALNDTATGPLGECREGWRYTDYTFNETTYPVVPVGSEAAYLAAGFDKSTQNPMTRPTTGGDNTTLFPNGHIFDFATYLTRFSIATPDIVLIELGTNDINNYLLGAAITKIGVSLDRMIASIRAKSASIYIGLVPYVMARSNFGDSKAAARVQMIQQFMYRVRNLADPKLHVVPAYAAMTTSLGYPVALKSTHPLTGISLNKIDQSISGAVHPDRYGQHQMAEEWAKYIAAVINGLI